MTIGGLRELGKGERRGEEEEGLVAGGGARR